MDNEKNINEAPGNTSDCASDNELSLIDLCAVLIRYRKLIIIGTVLVTILAGIWFLVMPRFKDSKVYNVEATLNVRALPAVVESALQQSVGATLVQKVMSSLYITKKLREFPVLDKSIYDLDSIDYNTYVIETFLRKEKKFSVAYNTATRQISLKLQTQNLDAAQNLIDSIIVDMNEYLQALIVLQVESIVQNTQSLIEKNELLLEKLSLENSSGQTSLWDVEQKAIQVLNSTEPLITEEGIVFIIAGADQSSYFTQLIIVCIASFFVFCLLAFVLSGIQNIKKDSESMSKIKNAWKSGK